MEMPPVTIGHVETRSPMNVLGAKGHGRRQLDAHARRDRHAVAGRARPRRHTLPLTLAAGLGTRGIEVQPAQRPRSPRKLHDCRRIAREGAVTMPAPPSEVWRRLIDPAELARIVPGCKSLEQVGPDRYRAEVMIGVAGIRGPLRGADRAHRQARAVCRYVLSARPRARSASAPAKAW